MIVNMSRLTPTDVMIPPKINANGGICINQTRKEKLLKYSITVGMISVTTVGNARIDIAC
jgi:hypothetical protein